MNRILDLQKLENTMEDDMSFAASSSSLAGCKCSTASGSCSIGVEEMMAI